MRFNATHGGAGAPRRTADTAALHGFEASATPGRATRSSSASALTSSGCRASCSSPRATYVWLDQLSRAYGRPIFRLDQIPDEELDRLAAPRLHRPVADRAVGAQPGVARRSSRCAATPRRSPRAYSLMDYRIADDLGGEEAYRNLRDRAWQRGIRLASDMVPNHMGIDSRWVVEHPDWFMSRPDPPYPAYSLQRAEPVARRARRHLHRGPLLRQHRRGGGVQARATTGAARRASSTTATTAHRCPGTTPRSSTTSSPRCARRSSRPSCTSRASSRSSASTRR